MAKGSRASSIKANNSKLKSRVFGPVETERTARLSAKLMELASQPKPARTKKEDVTMEEQEASADTSKAAPREDAEVPEAMDVDTSSAKLKSGKGRIEKRKASSRKASIVFPKYKNGKKVSRAGKK